MSTWFSSYIVYGVKVPYDVFEEVAGEAYWDDDMLNIRNNEEGIGWCMDDGDWAIYGIMVHEGTDNGNDTPLGGDGQMAELRTLSGTQQMEFRKRVRQTLGTTYADQVKYYVVGEYS